MLKILRLTTDYRLNIEHCYLEIEAVAERHSKAYSVLPRVQILQEETMLLADYPYRVHYVLTYYKEN